MLDLCNNILFDNARKNVVFLEYSCDISKICYQIMAYWFMTTIKDHLHSDFQTV